MTVSDTKAMEATDISTLPKGPMIGIRHIQSTLMFLLLSIGYAMRVNLSVGIVAMTARDPPSSKNPNVPIYDWGNTDVILAAFYIGYITLQIYAGELGKKYGVKWFLIGAMGINAVACGLTPLMAQHFGSYGVLTVRLVQGMFQGFFFPSVHNILGKWAPKEERSTLGNFIFTGVAFGTIFALPITGVVSASWSGWPMAFYIFALLGLLWCALYFILGSNTPQQHKSITAEEKNYILTSLAEVETKKPPPTPWKGILTSMPLWAIVVANFGQNWGYATLLTETPKYLKNVAGQDISKSAFLSAAPYLALFLLGLLFGPLTDWLITKQYFTRGNARKLMNSIGSLGPAITLVILGFLPADNIVAIEAFLILSVGINAAIWSGFQVNHVDLSPNFSGVLMGIGNGSSNIFSIIAPLMVKLIVHDNTDPTQWRWVFIIAALWYIASDIFYVIFAQGELQWWDKVEEDTPVNSVVIADSKEEKK